jgi:hypothetical protein
MKKFTRGAVAGAAGTTALNAVGYADMAMRGRPASSVPARVAEQLARRVGGIIPGNDVARQNRLEGLGALAGIATGAGVGALAGQLRGAVRRLGPLAGPAVIGGAAMLVTDVTTALLGVSDPRTWDAASWLSDIVPHLAFGAVVYAALPQSRAAAPPSVPSAAGSEESRAGGAARGPAGPGKVAPAEPAPPAEPTAPASSVLEHAAVLGGDGNALDRRPRGSHYAKQRRPAGRPEAPGGPPDRRDRRWRGAARRQAPRDAITPRPAGTYRPAYIRQPGRRGSRAF